MNNNNSLSYSNVNSNANNSNVDNSNSKLPTNPPPELRGPAKNRFYRLYRDPQKTAIEPFSRIGEDTYSSILDNYKSCPFDKKMYDSF